MSEAVIVDAIRTPIGRAVKGSLKDVRNVSREAQVAGGMGPAMIVERLN